MITLIAILAALIYNGTWYGLVSTRKSEWAPVAISAAYLVLPTLVVFGFYFIR